MTAEHMASYRQGSYCSSGTPGFDDILSGGLPGGKVTLFTGAPGTGKTLMSTAFACSGVADGHGAVYASFEERPEAVLQHARFLGHDADMLADSTRFRVLDMRPGHQELSATSQVNIGPVRTRIEHAVSETGATRLVLDSVDSLSFIFGARESTQRELLRIIEWIREQGITAILTSFHQPAAGSLRHLELIPHLCDCIVELSQDVKDHIMTRYLRVAKYRGSSHGTNVYPFIIDREGIFVLPITSTTLSAPTPSGTLSTGVGDLDRMLDGLGISRGTVLQVSGRSGTGKTLLAASIARSACQAGLKTLYVSFEESQAQLLQNLSSTGNDLSGYLDDASGSDAGRLTLAPVRAVELSLEGHLVNLIRRIDRMRPEVIILDPVSSLREQGSITETKSTILRLVNHLKDDGMTLVLTELLPDAAEEHSTMNISSIVDTWIRLRLVEVNGELARLIHIAKSRGIKASNQVLEFRISSEGLGIEMPYIGPGEMVVGTAKKAREQEELRQRRHAEQRLKDLRRQLAAREQILALQRELEEASESQDLDRLRLEIESLEMQLANQADDRDLARRARQRQHES